MDFPHPVCPTIATCAPAGTVERDPVQDLRTGRGSGSGRRRVRTEARRPGAPRRPSGSTTSIGRSSTASTLRQPAIAVCVSL